MTDRSIRTTADLDSLTFRENGLLPVVVQEANSGTVLMVAFANREALDRTIKTGQMHFWSRSRGELWLKGATSGHLQRLVSLHADCDRDTLLARVEPQGPACHTGERTCFGKVDSKLQPGRPYGGDPEGEDLLAEVLPGLWNRLQARAVQRPSGSYTVRLLDDENLRLKKLGEETAELLVALSRNDRSRIPEEAADLVYHLLVAMLAAGASMEELLAELAARMS